MGLFKKKNGQRTGLGKIFSKSNDGKKSLLGKILNKPRQGVKGIAKGGIWLIKKDIEIAGKLRPLARGIGNMLAPGAGDMAVSAETALYGMAPEEQNADTAALEQLGGLAGGAMNQAAANRTAGRGVAGDYDGSGVNPATNGTAGRDPRDTNGDGKVSFAEGLGAVFGSTGGDLNGDGKTGFGEQVAGWLGGAVRGAASGAAAGAGGAFIQSDTGQAVKESLIEKYTPHAIAGVAVLGLLFALASRK